MSIRRTLLGLDDDVARAFSASQRRMLVAFEFVTWLYRLVLFLGIAVTVYLFFFKLLGIIPVRRRSDVVHRDAGRGAS